jgi:chromosome segregation ATPase
MISEIKQHIAQLVETNRGIARELDASRRAIVGLNRERDALREHAEQLQEQVEDLRSISQREPGRVQQRVPEEMLYEHAALLRELEAAKAQASLADQRAKTLATELVAVEQERDEMRQQLLESSDVMDEVLRTLESAPPEAGPYRRRMEAI